MGTIPPFRWEDLATKQDLRELREWTDQRLRQLEARMASPEDRFENRSSGWDHRFEAIDMRFKAIDTRFVALNERLDRQGDEIHQLREEQRERFAVLQAMTQPTRTIMIMMAATVAAVGALAVALAGLT